MLTRPVLGVNCDYRESQSAVVIDVHDGAAASRDRLFGHVDPRAGSQADP
jgi:hypothetical protein